MKKRNFFLLVVLSIGWLQPFCTAGAATTRTVPQNYSTVMNTSLTEETGTASSTTTSTQQTSEEPSTNKTEGQEPTVKNENVINGS
ncbi:hypothetical protein LVP20_002199, partial [Enterococcus faecalis]|nr:hypothetical protein [Enterococcus faecalis]